MSAEITFPKFQKNENRFFFAARSSKKQTDPWIIKHIYLIISK
jgi:hypothetical protein